MYPKRSWLMDQRSAGGQKCASEAAQHTAPIANLSLVRPSGIEEVWDG